MRMMSRLSDFEIRNSYLPRKVKKEGMMGTRKEGTGMGPRKSRSKERPRVNNNNNNNGSSERQSLSDYERIKEREKELERIHRRSRELMASPRSQDGSLERRRTGGHMVDQHHRMTANCQPTPISCQAPPLYP